jgi:hypothetical protein
MDNKFSQVPGNILEAGAICLGAIKYFKEHDMTLYNGLLGLMLNGIVGISAS